MNPKVHSLLLLVICGLWVVMMCQYRFTFGKTGTILVSDVDNGGGYTCMGARGIWYSVSVSQFYCKIETA